MRSFKFVGILVVIILVAASILWTYQVRAAGQATEFLPTVNRSTRLPAGTVIEAVIRTPFPRSLQKGDMVTAFVAKPVSVGTKLVIPVGAQMRGPVEQVTVTGKEAAAQIDFNALSIGTQSFAMRSHRVLVRGPVQSDADIFTTGLRMLMGTTFGVAVGAESRDVRLIDRGMLEGARNSMPNDVRVTFRVTLSADLEVAGPQPR
jgi:hypothetical protein